MSGPILSRFDLVFILLDKPDENKDRFLSEHIMQVIVDAKIITIKMMQSKKQNSYSKIPGSIEHDGHETLSERLKYDEEPDLVPSSLLRKFIAYARRYCHPR